MSYLAISGEMEKFEKEIGENKDKYVALRENVKSILGESHYRGVYGFFRRLLIEEEINFLIIMSRRCLVLCQIFIIFLILEREKINEALTILSDKAIPYYGNSMKGKVVIADDILIHGRTIRKIYDLLRIYGSKMDIRICGYDKDIDMDCLPDELKDITTVETVDYKSEWRNLSNNFVRCIYASNVPYTSFVSSFYQYLDTTILEQIKQIGSIKIIENTETVQNEEGLSSYYCYEENCEENGYDNLLLAKGIRLYWNKNIEKMTIIPYVFIKRMLVDETNAVFEKVAKELEEKYPYITSILRKEERNVYLGHVLADYKMRLLTCLYCNAYWMDFKNRYNITGEFLVDVDTLEKGFGELVAKDIITLRIEDAFKLLSLDFKMKEFTEEVEDENIEIWKGCRDEISKKWIRRYFQRAWYEDERKAKLGEERSLGISIDHILNTFKKRSESKHEILAILVNTWDTGIAAANFVVDEKNACISCYNASGEQSYRILLEKYPDIFFYLIAVSKLITKGDAKEAKIDFEKYRSTKLIKLLDLLHENQEIADYDDIVNIIKQEKGYLSAWNQVNIISKAKPYDLTKNLPNIVDEFVYNNLK